MIKSLLLAVAVIALALSGCLASGMPAATSTPLPTPTFSPSPTPADGIALTEVARHATARDCWMAIRGKVYDVSLYTSHPGGPGTLAEGCGKEATELYDTMGSKGRPHSATADQILKKYYKGTLVAS